MCFPSNLGEHLSIDETSFSNGELYTIVTNKDGHGKKGSLIAMIKGTKSDDVCRWLLRKLPVGKRRKVKTITLDMSGSMSRIAKKMLSVSQADYRPVSCAERVQGCASGPENTVPLAGYGG